jgi:hypothetical protein
MMAKRRVKKVLETRHASARLREALTKQTKADLVDTVAGLAKKNRTIFRALASRIGREAPAEEIAATTRQAISDATDYDEREINYNFDYDDAAYAEVKRSFGLLIRRGELRLAMKLALELMSGGSAQVEMSDEGLMASDIEECLAVVVKAPKKCDLPPAEVVAWCKAMTRKDRVGFIFDRELATLCKQFER